MLKFCGWVKKRFVRRGAVVGTYFFMKRIKKRKDKNKRRIKDDSWMIG